MTTAERIDQILGGWPDEPSDQLTEAAARVWATLQPSRAAA